MFNRTSWTNQSSLELRLLSLTMLERSILILFLVSLFWLIFLLIYISIRLMIRLTSQWKRTSSVSTNKVCEAFVISSTHHYGSFRPSDLQCVVEQPVSLLLEHYLRTYNPWPVDLTDSSEQQCPEIEEKKVDRHLFDHCYPLNCSNYRRLQEENSCVDDQPSECSSKLTQVTLPLVMITDCSDSHRLHTEIVEMNEED